MNGSEGRGQAEPGKGEGSGKSLERKPGKTHKQSMKNPRGCLIEAACRRPSVKEARDRVFLAHLKSPWPPQEFPQIHLEGELKRCYCTANWVQEPVTTIDLLCDPLSTST